MSGRSLLRFFGLVALAAACGGRTMDEVGTAGGGSGATSSAGSASGGSGMSMGARGGAAGRPGAGGSGGTVAAGGVSTGGVSSAGMPTAGGGCGPCPVIDCAPGSTPRMLPGWCCAQCVNEDCSAGRAEYQVVRQQLLDKYWSVGCMLDDDCTYWYESNACAASCGVPILTSMLQNLESNLSRLAEETCSPQCMPPIPPCAPPRPAACVEGRCQ